MIWKVTHISSNVCKGLPEGVIWELKKWNDHGFFKVIQWYIIHAVLIFMINLRSIFLKKILLDVCLLCCFVFPYFVSYCRATIINGVSLTVVRYINEVESGLFLVVIYILSFYGLTFFCLIISLFNFFVYWIGMTVHFLTVSYTAVLRTRSLDYFWIIFDRMTTIGSYLMNSCT